MQVQSKQYNVRNQRAFTLVELLTVIAIIAVLAALLIPGLRTAIERARTAKCQSNLRQLATAIQMYVEDHDGRMPLLAIHGWSVQYRQFEFFREYIPINSDVYQCPSATHGPEGNSGRSFNGVYGARYCITENDQDICTDYKIADNATGIEGRPPDFGAGIAGHPVWTFKDHTWIVAAIDIEWTPVDGRLRHGDGFNVAFLAGHVMWFSDEDLSGSDPHGNTPWYRWGLDPTLAR